jgi:peroxiredoxin
MSNVEVGQKAPGFTLPDMYGKKVSLGDYHGRLVVLVFIRHLG